MFFGGILAFGIPLSLVPEGSGDTEAVWLAGLTALCLGIPLSITGVGLLIGASIKGGGVAKRTNKGSATEAVTNSKVTDGVDKWPKFYESLSYPG